MSEFFENFKFDEFDDPIPWVTSSPVFIDAELTYEFDSLRGCVKRNQRRRRNATVEVYAHNELENGYQEFQQAAWGDLSTYATSVETAVAEKLWPICRENFTTCIASLETHEKTWSAIRSREQWDDKSVLLKQIALTGISLFDTEIAGHGIFSLDFAVGWDEEHGVSLLMVRDKVIAKSGLADFICRGESLLDHAKYIQNYDFTQGDLRI
ncbi:DUF6985 domain-containing protein [Rhodopirellula sp. P2]|uniref:DUF6985 domain-containing protein n=1 Tax=Rhodopirellula sp. P2 TaxID=2127060 RepID=UPI0023681EA2|nr:hypothetical protein [Rhodopirellula sp. P2]WDQ14943.1 hypothetical protein PSR62_14985 [Rhodopirellula sp. P2]